MYKVVAKTRKGNLKRILLRKVSEAEAKAYVRNHDWFYADELNRFYDLFVEEWKGN